MGICHLIGACQSPASPQLSIFIILETKCGDMIHTVGCIILSSLILMRHTLEEAVPAVAHGEECGAKVSLTVRVEQLLLPELPRRHSLAFGVGGYRHGVAA